MVVADASEASSMFRPPVNRAMQILDRSLFQKTIPLSAAKVRDRKQIAILRQELGRDLLRLERFQTVQNIREPEGDITKALLLQPGVRADEIETWSPKLSNLAKDGRVDVVPFNLELTYNYWDYYEIMQSILPEEEHDNIPTGYAIVGHVAHLNLRDEHHPFKKIIAAVLLDKHPNIRTVINKIDNVGADNPYRTFAYELLGGDANLNVEVSEGGCLFNFDYSKVYWNSRLNTEHQRLVDSFQPGEAVCDVMAGVGPFSIPAGKKKCWVMANDLNPDSFIGLETAIKRNKVGDFVIPFRMDGKEFVRSATKELLDSTREVDITPPPPRHQRNDAALQTRPRKIMKRPQLFDHYVLNLPASALTFLSSFVGIYAGREDLFKSSIDSKLPLIHVYCFNSQALLSNAEAEICSQISDQLDFAMKSSGFLEGADGGVSILDVRDVAPNKRMYCARFRIPKEVAFREPDKL